MSLATVETTDEITAMQINTRFGLQSIDPESVIEFPAGLPGFDGLSQFKLFHEEGTHTVFYLQSVEDPTVQLPLVSPDNFQVTYEITLSDEELSQLQLNSPADATILVTVARANQAPDGELHANFLGPIVLNTKARVGLQKALKFSRRLSVGWASWVAQWICDLRGAGTTSYYQHALTEQDFRNRRAKHIVYGHTHHAEVVPLDASHAEGFALHQAYFNSGTWRRDVR